MLWGAGLINTEQPNGSIFNETGDTWANSLTVGTLQIDGEVTATSYSAGTWTDGVDLTTANLDSDGGLQRPTTGSRYC